MKLHCLLALLLASCQPTQPPVAGDAERDDNTYSIGQRAGTIVKFSRKGARTPSFEGTMIVGGMTTKTVGECTSTVAETWNFSVTDTDQRVARDVFMALHTGQRVVVVYKQVKAPTGNDVAVCDTAYHVKAITLPNNGVLTYLDGVPCQLNDAGLPVSGEMRGE